MAMACSMHMSDEKCIQNLGQKTKMENTTWKAWAQMGRQY
jgi:hypothetical protein